MFEIFFFFYYLNVLPRYQEMIHRVFGNDEQINILGNYSTPEIITISCYIFFPKTKEDTECQKYVYYFFLNNFLSVYRLFPNLAYLFVVS